MKVRVRVRVRVRVGVRVGVRVRVRDEVHALAQRRDEQCVREEVERAPGKGRG